MNFLRLTVKLVIISGLLLAFTGCNANLEEISGKVAMVGHSPFTYLSVRGEDQVEYKVVGLLEEKLTGNYQGKVVTLKGGITKKAIGPGFPAEFTAVKIIE